MTEQNLANCFMPCLFIKQDAMSADPFKEMMDAKVLSRVLTFMIKHY